MTALSHNLKFFRDISGDALSVIRRSDTQYNEEGNDLRDSIVCEPDNQA